MSRGERGKGPRPPGAQAIIAAITTNVNRIAFETLIRQLWKICQAFQQRYRSFVADSRYLPRQKSPTNLAGLFLELDILNIRVEEEKFFLCTKRLRLAGPLYRPP
jgi:hypothetical protein